MDWLSIGPIPLLVLHLFPQGLLSDLRAADETRAAAAQAHAEVTAQLLALHERQSGQLQASFLDELKAMQQAFERRDSPLLPPLLVAASAVVISHASEW